MQFSPLICDQCGLDKGSQVTKRYLEAEGILNPDILIICDPLASSTEGILREAIDISGVPRDRIAITYAVRCRSESTKPAEEQIKLCSKYLLKDIYQIKPKVLLLLGDSARLAILNKSGNITKERGVETRFTLGTLQFPVLSSYNLNYVGYRSNWKDITSSREGQDLIADIKKCYELSGQNLSTTDDYEHIWVDSVSVANQMFDDIEHTIATGKSQYLACDTETMGNNPYLNSVEIVLISLCVNDTRGYALPLHHPDSPWDDKVSLGRIYPRLKSILEKYPIVGQNFIFDTTWLICKLGIYPYNLHIDCMDAHQLLFCGDLPNDLGYMAAKYCGIIDHKKEMQDFLDTLPKELRYNYNLVPKDLLNKYGADDAIATYRLAPVLEGMLRKDNMWDTFCNLYQSTFKARVHLEYNGPAISIKEYNHLMTVYPPILEKEMESLRDHRFVKVYEEYRAAQGKKGTDITFNPRGAQQRLALIYDIMGLPILNDDPKEKDKRSFDKKGARPKLLEYTTANGMTEEHDLLKHLCTFMDNDWLFNNHVVAMNKYLHPRGEQVGNLSSYARPPARFTVHPHYALDTLTGRASCKNPPLHGCPFRSSTKRQYISRWSSSGGSVILCLSGDTRIPLLDSTTPTIKELFDVGKKQWVYSYDFIRNKITFDLAEPVKTGIKKKMLCVELDDGTVLRVTPDHVFYTVDRRPVVAENLSEGVSLLALHRKLSTGYILGYEEVRQPNGYWEYTHRIVASEIYGLRDSNIVHHKNICKLDNSPENLLPTTKREHHKMHKELGSKLITTYNKSDKHRKVASETQKRIARARVLYHRSLPDSKYNSVEYKLNQRKSAAKQYKAGIGLAKWAKSDANRERGRKIVKTDDFKRKRYHTLLVNVAKDMLRFGLSVESWDISRSVLLDSSVIDKCVPKLSTIRKYGIDILSVLDSATVNHKVVRVYESLVEEDTYCLKTAYGNFAIAPGVFVHNCDFSQHELRVLAALSGDENLRKVFEDKVDLHKYVASQAYKVPVEKITKVQRRRAKTASFGIVYGIAATSLASQHGCSVEEAQALIDGIYQLFPKVRQWMDAQIDFAMQYGYITTPLGRKRPLRISQYGKGGVERRACNSPIQSGASDLTLLAISRIDRDMESSGMRSLVMGFIHDSILIDVYPGEFSKVYDILVYNMKTVIPQIHDWYRVPCEMDVEIGSSWRDLLEVSKQDTSVFKLKGDAEEFVPLFGRIKENLLKAQIKRFYDLKKIEKEDSVVYTVMAEAV